MIMLNKGESAQISIIIMIYILRMRLCLLFRSQKIATDFRNFPAKFFPVAKDRFPRWGWFAPFTRLHSGKLT